MVKIGGLVVKNMNSFSNLLFFLLFFAMIGHVEAKDKEVSKQNNKSKLGEELLKKIMENIDKSKKNKNIKEPAINKEIAKIIEKKNKLVKDVNKLKDSIDASADDKFDLDFENNKMNFVNKIRESKDITLTFDNYLLSKNTEFKKKKYLKYVSKIKYIDFCQLDLFRILTYIRNFYRKSGDYFYEIDLNLANIFFGFNLTLGLDFGFSFIKKDGFKNYVPFVNIDIGYKYSEYGYFQIIIGGSRVNYNNIYYWPLWYAITPINISVDIYRFKNSPIGLTLNVKLLFKGIITEDMADFQEGFRVIDKNKIFPYIGDMSNPNLFKTFIDLKIYLGFRFFN